MKEHPQHLTLMWRVQSSQRRKELEPSKGHIDIGPPREDEMVAHQVNGSHHQGTATIWGKDLDIT